MASFVSAGGFGFLILAAALGVGLTRRRKRVSEPTVYRMISPRGPVETFDLSGRPSPARIAARGEGLVATLTRKHMAGPGVAWFEPGSPLVFELDSGDIHVIPREHITDVEQHEGQEPQRPGEQLLKVTLSGTASLWLIMVHAKMEDCDRWFQLRAAND